MQSNLSRRSAFFDRLREVVDGSNFQKVPREAWQADSMREGIYVHKR